VSVKRAGAQLKYRRGYYAFADEQPDDAHRQRVLNDAAASVLDATAIGFSVGVNMPAPGSSTWQLVMDVDTNSIKLEPLHDNWAGGLDLMFAQFDAKGNLLKSNGRQVPLTLSAADREQLLQHGFVLNAPIQLKESCDRLRIVLRDMKTGAIGSVTVEIRQTRPASARP
jgi:hypothetical protein